MTPCMSLEDFCLSVMVPSDFVHGDSIANNNYSIVIVFVFWNVPGDMCC